MTQSADVFKVLGNDTRLSIVRELARRGREVSGHEILTSCSVALDLAQPTLSQHFAKLVRCGVLHERKEGIEKRYRLNVELLRRSGVDIGTLQAGGNE